MKTYTPRKILEVEASEMKTRASRKYWKQRPQR
jgi:hypothetical protein